MIKKLTHTMYPLLTLIYVAILTLAIGICGTLTATEIADRKAYESYHEIVCDVIAENDEFYILQNCDDVNEFIQVDKSEMYGVGETVQVVYVDGQITSICLYVDC